MIGKSILTIGVTALLSAMVVIGATDEEIKSYLIDSMFYIDNSDGVRWDRQHAWELCEGDTNRFARIICELAHTNHQRIAKGMISFLGVRGTAEQLPFLYSQVSNTEYGVNAVLAILRIEGVTSNSVSMVENYLALTNVSARNRYYACEALVGRTFAPGVTPSVKADAVNVELRFMAEVNIFHDWLDETMKRCDSSYAVSKRRLSVLRSVSARTSDPNDLNYVTNAINELVAYPEADLPD